MELGTARNNLLGHCSLGLHVSLIPGFPHAWIGGDLRGKEETELGRRESTWLVGVFLVSGIHSNPCALSAGPGCRERPR